jgi:hypothetical protein
VICTYEQFYKVFTSHLANSRKFGAGRDCLIFEAAHLPGHGWASIGDNYNGRWLGHRLRHPDLPAYVLTGVCIAITVEILFRLRMYNTVFRAVISGLVVAIVSATVSAPVTTYLFGGMTLSGVDAITAYFFATGKTLLNSAVLSGLSSEPIDKVLVSLIAYFTLQRLPSGIAARFGLRLPSQAT